MIGLVVVGQAQAHVSQGPSAIADLLERFAGRPLSEIDLAKVTEIARKVLETQTPYELDRVVDRTRLGVISARTKAHLKKAKSSGPKSFDMISGHPERIVELPSRFSDSGVQNMRWSQEKMQIDGEGFIVDEIVPLADSDFPEITKSPSNDLVELVDRASRTAVANFPSLPHLDVKFRTTKIRDALAYLPQSSWIVVRRLDDSGIPGEIIATRNMTYSPQRAMVVAGSLLRTDRVPTPKLVDQYLGTRDFNWVHFDLPFEESFGVTPSVSWVATHQGADIVELPTNIYPAVFQMFEGLNIGPGFSYVDPALKKPILEKILPIASSHYLLARERAEGLYHLGTRVNVMIDDFSGKRYRDHFGFQLAHAQPDALAWQHLDATLPDVLEGIRRRLQILSPRAVDEFDRIAEEKFGGSSISESGRRIKAKPCTTSSQKSCR